MKWTSTMIQQISLTIQSLYRKRLIRIGFKTVLFVVLIFLLYGQLEYSLQNLSTEEFKMAFQNVTSTFGIILFVIVLLLVPVNWAFETLKWKSLSSSSFSIKFFPAFKAVLAGLTISMFTPNRVGEYGGRVLLMKPEHRMATVYSSIMGSIAQWIILLIGGILALFYLDFQNIVNYSFQDYIFYLFAVCLILLGILITFYFKQNQFLRFLENWHFTAGISKYFRLKFKSDYNTRSLIKALVFSSLRYLVYCSQYLLIIYAFSLSLGFFETFAAIAFIFLLQTGMPMPASVGLIARGSIALFVFGWLMPEDNICSQSAILCSTLLLWIFNVFFPAVIGAILIVVYSDKIKSKNSGIL